MNFSDQEKRVLLSLARRAITYFLDNREVIKIGENEAPENTRKNAPTFVTLKVDDKLHGCIGHTEPILPLYKDVISNAVCAAFDDPRFPRITKKDLERLTIEISLLKDFKKVEGKSQEEKIAEIEPKKDGVILENDYNRALFLPQVWEELPHKKDFLSHLSLKAGLPSSAFKNRETEFVTFRVESFSKRY